MNNAFDHLSFIENILSFSPRQGINEQKTATFLKDFLTKNDISFDVQEFLVDLPKEIEATLLADGKSIQCEPTSFVSGKIIGKHNLVSNLISTQPLIDLPNINFNPECESISKSNHYFAPSVAINKKDVAQVLAAKTVEGSVTVEPKQYQSANILVGNTENPNNILIAHYDSIKTGAIDNASGVAVLMALALDKNLFDDSLFVFSGNEELSYDKPVYWGHGFRVFEAEYKKQLEQASKIFVIDCVGNGPTTIDQDPRIMKLAFPLTNIDRFASKVFLVSGDIDDLMTVYHSDEDTIEKLSEHYLREAAGELVKLLVP